MRSKRSRLRIIGIIVACVALSLLIVFGYRFGWPWTGFGPETTEPKQHPKTLWDWLQLLGTLLIPVMIAVFTYRQSQIEHETTSDDQRETALQEYFDKMSELLLRDKKNLRDSNPEDEVRVVARARTLTVLNGLDTRRKVSVLQFLYEAQLINKDKGDGILQLQGANLSNILVFSSTLSKVFLEKVNLSNATFYFQDLREANLKGANLTHATLIRVDLGGADLSGANLQYADLRRTNFQGADLSKAHLAVPIAGWLAIRTRLWNLAYNPRRPTLISRLIMRLFDKIPTGQIKANLSGANLREANLSEVDLSHFDLRGFDLNGTNLNKANLSKANLSGLDLRKTIMSDASLSEANLSKVNLSGIDLHEMIFLQTNLSGADLSYTDLSHARLNDVNLNGTNLSHANLSGAILLNVNLSGAKLSEANLQGTTLLKTDLKNLDLSQVNIKDAFIR